jgi:hypothetical protein
VHDRFCPQPCNALPAFERRGASADQVDSLRRFRRWPVVLDRHGLRTEVPFATSIALFPVAIAVAIFRYRLYDIDLIINRALVYGALSVTLALLYFSSVTLTQITFRVITDQEQQPQLVIVASTLMIAVLFNPLRHRMQEFIDQRFYRRKYDAAKTLEQFSSKLRDETDLNALSGDILAVVRETMQPEHVSLWLREPERKVGR